MNGILLLLVQAIEVIGCIAVIVWAIHEMKMAHREIREIKKDLNTECSIREAADEQLKKAIEIVVKQLRKLQNRMTKLEKRRCHGTIHSNKV